MINIDDINFEKIGFRAGLEVHHQIKSNRKLFCNCKPVLCDSEPDYRFERYFRPVLGEMGDFDEGMLIEYEKGYRVIYHAYEKSVCLYEQDEQPPFWPDYEAIYEGYELAHWLNFSAMVDEVVVSRKQYLDGSITTGFQRTMIVARDGWIPVNGKKMRISNLTIEEDAARKVKTENYGRTVYYNLDRLGIPLVEVITDHRDCHNPYDLKRLAMMIGLTLRISDIGCRGIGSVRQDVNISIEGGDRVEIKGVQNLDLFIELSKREVVRQDMLIKIAQKLKDNGLQKDELQHTYTDLTDRFPAKTIPEDYIIMGIRLPKFGEVLGEEVQPEKDFGQDILEKAELISGVPRSNMFHSSELADNAFRKKDLRSKKQEGVKTAEHFFFNEMNKTINSDIRKILNVSKNDGYFLALGPQNWVIHALKKVIERAKMALDGVPQETRRLLPNGNTEFLRVIHGKDRLYPDTDTPPLSINLQEVQKLKEKVEKRPWEIYEDCKKNYDLSFNQVSQLIRNNHIKIFYQLCEDHKISPGRAYHFLEETLRSLERDGLDINLITDEQIITMFLGAKEEKYDFNQIPFLVKLFINNPNKNLEQALFDLDTEPVSKEELSQLYQYIAPMEIKRNQQQPKQQQLDQQELAQKITNAMMSQISGGIHGKTVFTFVLNQLKQKREDNN
jgi:glutamyl-tRNA(Gln) amidotransferase subunit E